MASNPVIEAAEEYAKQSARYVTMRELGKRLGVTSHVVGRKLKKAGLRDESGKPSKLAIENGFTKSVRLQEMFPLDVWHEERTLNILGPII